MEKPPEFSFGDQSVAAAYDTVLVPILFAPWAARLIDDFKPWQGQCVVDLATGTGVVAYELAKQVGPTGKVIGTDINREMLRLARQRCAGTPATVEFIESPDQPLELADESVHAVVCQQGFQFFPDRGASAREIFRVLRTPGRTIVATWRPVGECDFFGSICASLESIGEEELSNLMRAPFDYLPDSELSGYFEAAGFQEVQVSRQQLDLTFPGGVPQAVEGAWATPIGPRLRMLPEQTQLQFRQALKARLEVLAADGRTMGRMVSNLLSAEKRA